MLANLLPPGALVSGLIGAAAIFTARKIAPIERTLDKAQPGNGKELPIPHLMTGAVGFPLGYVVAPFALAIVIHKFL